MEAVNDWMTLWKRGQSSEMWDCSWWLYDFWTLERVWSDDLTVFLMSFNECFLLIGHCVGEIEVWFDEVQEGLIEGRGDSMMRRWECVRIKNQSWREAGFAVGNWAKMKSEKARTDLNCPKSERIKEDKYWYWDHFCEDRFEKTGW